MTPQRNKQSYPSKISDPATWVESHGDYLFRYALMRLRNKEQAENIVQETFLAALTARQSFSGRSSERTWLIGILKHKIIDQYRKTFREKPISQIQTEEEQTIDQFYDAVENPKGYPKDWMPDPEKVLHSKEFWDTLKGCLGHLPARTAHAFTMREMDDMDTGDICKELEISPTNLWVMLHRARLQLRACLEQNWFEKK